MELFLICATIIFTFFAIIWKREDWLNFSLKCAFVGMAGWSAFLTAVEFGYVIAT